MTSFLHESVPEALRREGLCQEQALGRFGGGVGTGSASVTLPLAHRCHLGTQTRPEVFVGSRALPGQQHFSQQRELWLLRKRAQKPLTGSVLEME